jgi:hypothetical protein
MYVPFSVFCVLFVCKCVLYYCHRVSTEFQIYIYIYIYITKWRKKGVISAKLPDHSRPQFHLSLLGALALTGTWRHLAAKVGTSKGNRLNANDIYIYISFLIYIYIYISRMMRDLTKCVNNVLQSQSVILDGESSRHKMRCFYFKLYLGGYHFIIKMHLNHTF